MASLQAWCNWICRRPEKIKETLSQRCTQSCLWALTYTSPCEAPPANLVHSAAHLLQSVTAILKPNLWDQSPFTDLLCAQIYPHLKPDTVKVLRRALINGIILPPGDNSMRQRLMSM